MEFYKMRLLLISLAFGLFAILTFLGPSEPASLYLRSTSTNNCDFLSNATSEAVWANTFAHVFVNVSLNCNSSVFSITVDKHKFVPDYILLPTNAGYLTLKLKLNATDDLQDKELEITTFTRPIGGKIISTYFSLIIQASSGKVTNIKCEVSCGQLYCRWNSPELSYPLSVKYNLTMATLDNVYTRSHLLEKTNFLTNWNSIVQPHKEYSISISPVSPLGEGHLTKEIVTTSLVPNISADIYVTISNKSNKAIIIIKGMAAQVGCQPSYPTVFNVTRLSCSSNTSFSIPVTATNGTFSATIRSLRVNQPNCSIEFNWGNPSGHSPTEHYSFRTTIIQNFTAIVKKRSVELTCFFAINSLALSCVIYIHNSLTGELLGNFTITKDPSLSNSSMDISSLPSGNFTLTCAAVMPDGTKHPSHMNQTITIFDPSSLATPTPSFSPTTVPGSISRICCGLILLVLVLVMYYLFKCRKRIKCLKQNKEVDSSLRSRDASPPQQSPSQSPPQDQPRTPSPAELKLTSSPTDHTHLEVPSPQAQENTSSFTTTPISTTENESLPLLRNLRKGLDRLDLRKVSQSEGGSTVIEFKQRFSPNLPINSDYSIPKLPASPVPRDQTVFSFGEEQNRSRTYDSILHDPPYAISQQPLDDDEHNGELVASGKLK